MQRCVGCGLRVWVLFALGIQSHLVVAGSTASSPAGKIQPTIVYSSILPNPNDRITAVATGSDGSLYVAGVTISQASVGQSSVKHVGRPFVQRISPDGASVVFRTYLDTSASTEVRALAVDATGNAYVTGQTESLTLPMIHALQQRCGATMDGNCSGNGFVVKVDAQGHSIYSTYLGGSGADAASAVAVDDTGNIYLAGTTRSTDFPVINALQSSLSGSSDGFVTKIAADGSRILFSSYLGGTGEDEIRGLALDRFRNVYMTGRTDSLDFPTNRAIQANCRATQNRCVGEAFVSEISADGSCLVFSTYLGGSSGDSANAIAVSGNGDVYVGGSTRSVDFPTVAALQPKLAGKSDAFLTKFSRGGSKIEFSTYLGGADSEQARSLAIDGSGNVIVSGWTRSADFPVRNPIHSDCFGSSKGCGVDAFVAVLDSQGRNLLFSTPFGGSDVDVSEAVAADSQGSIYVGGWTRSTDFPQVEAVQQSTDESSVAEPHPGAFATTFGGVLPANTNVTCSSKTNNWTGSAGDNQWTTKTNWSDGRVPISSDTVCIASTFTSRITIGTLVSANQQISALTSGAPITFAGGPLAVSGSSTFDADLIVNSGVFTFNGFATTSTLELNGGVLSGSGGITTDGLLTWSGGEVCTNYSSQNQTCNNSQGLSTVFVNTGLSITGNVTLDSRRLNNVQTATVNGAFNVNLVDGSTVNNQSGAIWNLAADANITNGGASSNQFFANAGTFQKTGGTAVSTISVSFNNTGNVEVESATVDLTAGEGCNGGCAGSWQVASGATLQFDSGGYTLTGQIGGAGAAGAGTVNFATGLSTLSGNYNISGATTLGTATVNFNGTMTNLGAFSLNGGLADIVSASVSTIPVSTLTLNGGTLATNDNLTLSGLFTWSNGSLCTTYSSKTLGCVAPVTQAVTTANGGMSLGTGLLTLDGQVLNNSKTATMSAAQYNYLILLDSAVINNGTGATWDLTGDANINGPSGTFNNAGTFEKTAGTSTSTITPVFNNTGKVLANAATLDFVGGGSCTGTCSGSWTSAVGATLQFDTASFAFSGSMGGAGTVSFTSGTEVLTGAYSVTGTTNVTSAIVGFNQSGTVTFSGPVNLSGGFVYGTAALTFNALLTWTYGAMCTVYSTVTASCGPVATQSVANANGGISFPLGYPTLDGRTLNNSKIMTMSGEGYFVTMLDSAVINNSVGATWNVAADAGISGLTGIFNNLGTFEKTAGTGTSTIEVPFNNAGSVAANAALLDFAGGGTCGSACAGSWTVASAGTLQFDAGLYALSGPISGAGTLSFSSGTQTLTGNYSLTGTTNFSGAAVGFNQSALTFAGPVNISGGYVYGPATLTISGLLTWTYGAMCTTYSTTTDSCSAPVTQAVTNAKGGITFGSGNSTLDGRTLNSSKTSTMTVKGSSLTLVDLAVLNNSSGATWSFTNDANISGTAGQINNSGLFEKTGGTGMSTVTPPFSNAGNVEATSGVLNFGGIFAQTAGNTIAAAGRLSFASPGALTGGALSGSGTISGSVVNTSGTLAPGTTKVVGTVTLASSASDYTQGASGSYTVKVGGTGTGQYDQLVVGGAATLGGTLKISTINGFTPSAGQTFTIIRCGSESGQFSSVTKSWSVTYKGATVILTYQ